MPLILAMPGLLLLLGCCQQVPVAQPADIVQDEWRAIFDEFNARGTVILLDAATGTHHIYGPERASVRFPPASTFKVYNSLVALETGVIPDVDTMYTWDGVERGGAWDQDHSLRMGMRNSTVWLFQEIAEQIGKQRYERAFARTPYGNGLIGDSVRLFWLGEPLAISANEQVAYLDRLRKGELHFRPEVQRAVREMMVLEEESGYTLYGKTGWTWRKEDRSDEIGWIVGWVDTGDDSWIYALNVERAGPDFDMRTARREVLDAVLRHIGLGPPRVRD